MGDRLGIQGAVGFIFTLLTVRGALILPGQEPTSCPSLPCTLINTLAELKPAARQPPRFYGHTTLNIPHLVRSGKSSNVGLCQYLDG